MANLSIERVHFDVVPILSRAGGWGRANKVFNSSLVMLLSRLNEAVAVSKRRFPYAWLVNH